VKPSTYFPLNEAARSILIFPFVAFLCASVSLW
jgi:hypothetical protein